VLRSDERIKASLMRWPDAAAAFHAGTLHADHPAQHRPHGWRRDQTCSIIAKSMIDNTIVSEMKYD